MLTLSNRVVIPAHELEFQMIRASGPGGQHVNKASTAIMLIFDVKHSPSLPDYYKQRILSRPHPNLTPGGKIIIKAQQYRSQEMNRQDALARLKSMIDAAMVVQRTRIATKPTKASQKRRLDAKKRQGQTKKLRQSKPGSSD
ncbi:alternative ribosome rescue aminoacyl-tRNA hydrolase ArfB [Ferrimonas balearica]|uniref:alternative ribosome rescue aminoacyl-tRNA hydrolase ArfB n=1 Tax=Ferrimonas balearica TaxID=44012 RepID=UPI001C992585|nr:alternative ribosome rescue aminoacyl-tRNA hydrolase ArfB [Ferrimonas balearica]MBY5923102.1 aminoacyl-tRNA hydrolase [Ferrimonas balearica]MBY5997522.1 aminoacyl-tRNA hydrolase [Ferrimonas balearica]